MNTIIGWLGSHFLGKYLVLPFAWVHNKLDGHRTELTAVLLALVHGLRMANLVPLDQADALEKILLSILPVVFADKVSKVMTISDKIIPSVPPTEPPPIPGV